MTTSEIKLTGMMVLAFASKAVKSGVSETKEALLLALTKANKAFSDNYDSNEPILQKQFIANCTISVVNGVVDVCL